MPSDIHEAANTTKEGWIAWFCPLKLYRHYSGCRIWSGLLYRNYIKLYVSFCAARPGFVAYLFVVQYTTAVLYRCFYIRFVLPLIDRTNIDRKPRTPFFVSFYKTRIWSEQPRTTDGQKDETEDICELCSQEKVGFGNDVWFTVRTSLFWKNRIRFGIAQTTLGGGGQLRLRIMPCKEAQKGLEQIWFCPCLLLSLT